MSQDKALLLYMLFRDEIEQSTDTSNLCDSQSNSDIYIQYHPILNYYRDKVKMLHNTILDLQENNEYLTNDIVELEYELDEYNQDYASFIRQYF
mgnify:CR=1 FL=1